MNVWDAFNAIDANILNNIIPTVKKTTGFITGTNLPLANIKIPKNTKIKINGSRKTPITPREL